MKPAGDAVGGADSTADSAGADSAGDSTADSAGADSAAVMHDEIASQPSCWLRAAEAAEAAAAVLPRPGEAVAFSGCGSSWHMATAAAAVREGSGGGRSDAFCASEALDTRDYDLLVAVTRTGTTTEVVRLLEGWQGRGRKVVVSTTPSSPAVDAADEAVIIDFADDAGVVQTRSATTAFVLIWAAAGGDVPGAASAGEIALTSALPPGLHVARRHVFLGTGWAYGIAEEAALKLREAAGAWAEAYPAMEYRHGPASAVAAETLVWAVGTLPDGLEEFVRTTGAGLVGSLGHPLADLVLAQRAAVDLASAAGLDPAHPAHLGRSVILD